MKARSLSSTLQKITIRFLSLLESKPTDKQNGKVVYVTSASDQEGKSFISQAIAMCAANITQNRVLLIDGNMEKPSLDERLGIPEQKGLSELLLSDGEFDIEYTEVPDCENLYYLSSGKKCRPGLLFKPQRVQQLIAEMQKEFDLIIVDSASIHRSGANSLAMIADGIIIVIDASSTRKQVLESAKYELNVDDDKILGAVMNKKVRYIPDAIYRWL